MSATKLKCPNCGAPIPSKNINIQKMVAVCEECDSVFTFDDLSDSLQQSNSAIAKVKPIAPPEQATINRTPDSLELKLKWSIKTEWTLNLVIMGIWLAVALFIVFMGVLSGAKGILVVGGLGMLLSVLPAYYFATLFANSTHVRVQDGQLHIESRPLYYPGHGKKTIALDEIEHIYAEPSRYYSIMNHDITYTRHEDLFYDVVVELTDGKLKRLVEFINYEHSLYIVQEVELYLHEASYDNATLFESNKYDSTLLDAPLIDGELPLPDESTNTTQQSER